MIYHKEQDRSYLKWLLAFLVFVLAMTVTFSDVHGFSFATGRPDLSGYQGPEKSQSTQEAVYGGFGHYDTGSEYGYIWSETEAPENCPPPPQVPEPASLLLLSTGLFGFYIAQRRKQR